MEKIVIGGVIFNSQMLLFSLPQPASYSLGMDWASASEHGEPSGHGSSSNRAPSSTQFIMDRFPLYEFLTQYNKFTSLENELQYFHLHFTTLLHNLWAR